MSQDPACCTPQDTIQRAAQLMRDCDCGCIPVVEDKETRKLIGLVTDRDIAIRCVAAGRPGTVLVEEVMTEDVSCCGAYDELLKAEEIMVERQVRRVPVIDGEGRIIGIISQADVVRAASNEAEVKDVVEAISEPPIVHH